MALRPLRSPPLYLHQYLHQYHQFVLDKDLHQRSKPCCHFVAFNLECQRLLRGMQICCFYLNAYSLRGKTVSFTRFIYFIFRNDWDPPDRKVDTRKFRSEPRSIFEYEPGKSSILEHERPVSKVGQYLT